MQDCTDVPFRTGRHPHVHGVVTDRGTNPGEIGTGARGSWQGFSAGGKGEAGGSFCGRAQLLHRPTETPCGLLSNRNESEAGEKVDGLVSSNLRNVSDDTLMVLSRMRQSPQRTPQSSSSRAASATRSAAS